MEDHEAPYQYQPMNASYEIRVLHVEPGAFAEPLRGSLVVQKIRDAKATSPAYDCVSYCWGTQENFVSFNCDGKALRITATVDEMLRHLRKPTESCYL